MHIAEPQRRLKSTWGAVDRRHASLIAEWTRGSKVLDLGCGFGSTTAYLTREKHQECVGVDNEEGAIRVAKELFPYAEYRVADARHLPFPDATFDTVVLRDSLHHFCVEPEFDRIKKELLRVAKKDARIIFFDPNVNFVLKACRKLMFHKDEECTYEKAGAILRELGFELKHHSFNTVASLPLSGGYVGINFVPNAPIFHRALLFGDRIIEKIVDKMALARQLCWRYLLVGDRV